MRNQTNGNFASHSIGDRVRIRESQRSPYPGQSGVVSSVDLKDARAPYLVRFADGMEFRYKAQEVESAHAPASQDFTDRLMKFRLYRMFVLAARQVLSPGSTQPHFDHSVPSRSGTRQS
jgi:hypothetical protein